MYWDDTCTCFDEGYDAWWDFYGAYENPYLIGSWNYFNWLKGWMAAKADAWENY